MHEQAIQDLINKVWKWRKEIRGEAKITRKGYEGVGNNLEEAASVLDDVAKILNGYLVVIYSDE